MNGPFRRDAASWSPVGAMIGEDTTTVAKPRHGPSLVFAIAVIGGVALATAGVVSTFFVEPSEGAPDEQAVMAAEAPVETASLDTSFLPVRKVVTQHIRVKAAQPAAPQETVEAAADIDLLAPLDPRWARAAAPSPEVAASVAAVDPTDGTETAAITPDQAYASRTDEGAEQPGADAATTDDPIDLVARARPAQLSKSANMRSRPKSGSSVVMVVPRSAIVQLVGCKVWCEIVYKGRRGYVYKDFFGGSRRASAASKVSSNAKPKAASAKPNAEKTVETSASGLPGVETQAIKPLSSRLQ